MPQAFANLFSAAVLREDRSPSVERHDQMAALSRLERCTATGEKSLGLARVRQRNINVVSKDVNICVALAGESAERSIRGRRTPLRRRRWTIR